jgi:putative spermidine/putrescine transport system ATP-binding protein
LRGQVTSLDQNLCTVVTDDGQQVQALAVNVSQPGQATTLSLRPERVLISPPAGTVDNVFEARVLELIYLGDHIRARVALLGREDFIVKVPNSANHVAMREGDTVVVGWQRDDCRALDAPQ